MAEVTLIYDGDCLLCQQFQRYIALKQRHKVMIRDAREEQELVSDLAAQGYDINQGMIVLVGDKVFVGQEAAMQLDCLIAGTTRIDSCLLAAAQQGWLVRFIYPLFKVVRTVLFWLQGKSGRITV